MKTLFKSVLLLLVGALLLSVCAVAAPAVKTTRPPCYHRINGHPASIERVEFGKFGTHVYWACSDAKASAPTWYGFSCLPTACSEALLAEVTRQVTRSSAKVTTANAVWDKYIEFDCATVRKEQSARGDMCREREAILSTKKAQWSK